MSRGTAARRRRDDSEAWLVESFRVADERDELLERGEHLDEENARLKEQMAEVEGWYRLLRVDHSALQAKMTQSSRRLTELQTEANRLAAENQELQALVSRPVAAVPDSDRQGEGSSMTRIFEFVRRAQRHKWATAAVVTIATLLVRDPTVQGVLGSAVDRVRQAAWSRASDNRIPADSGFLRYAAMINSREQAERARQDYNEKEAQLRGDALLDAQDRLRSAKTRYRQARLAFLPELARRCEQARTPLPREAAEALTALNNETAE
jgi:hypothetical protein